MGQQVFEEAIMKMLVQRGRTVLLVTHQLQYLPQAHNVIVMKDGQAVICSNFKEVGKSQSDNVKLALTLTREQSMEHAQQLKEDDEGEVKIGKKATVKEEIKEAEKEEKKE